MYRILLNSGKDSAAAACRLHFLEEGHQVWIWEDMEQEERSLVLQGGIDLLVLSLSGTQHAEGAFAIGQGLNFGEILLTLEENTQPLLSLVREVTPFMETSSLKRIAYLTRKEYSIRETSDESEFGLHMAAAANHMMMKVLFNTLRPQGFTFRCYAWSPGEAGIPAWKYLLRDQSNIASDPVCHSDENRLVLRDGRLSEIPW